VTRVLSWWQISCRARFGCGSCNNWLSLIIGIDDSHVIKRGGAVSRVLPYVVVDLVASMPWFGINGGSYTCVCRYGGINLS
jgi:hypothetical protein